MAKKQAVGTLVKFEDMLNKAFENMKKAEAVRKQKEEEARLAKKEEEMCGREVTRLNRIAYLAGFERNTMVWTLTHETVNDSPSKYNPRAWSKTWELNTSMLDFSIHLTERTDMKRDKWEVKVRAWHRTLSERGHEIHGGYTNHTYGQEKYAKYISYGNYEDTPGQELTKKFKSLKEAEAFVNAWKERLVNDHIGEIEYERALREQCLATGFKYDDKRKFW